MDRRALRPLCAHHKTGSQSLDRFIGAQATLETAILNGRGAAQIGDTIWPVVGPDLPQGARVIVTSTDGTLLTVRPAAS